MCTPKITEIVALSNVVNECVCDGVFRDSLKFAKVVPIFASRDSKNPTNYIPIVATTYLS